MPYNETKKSKNTLVEKKIPKLPYFFRVDHYVTSWTCDLPMSQFQLATYPLCQKTQLRPIPLSKFAIFLSLFYVTSETCDIFIYLVFVFFY